MVDAASLIELSQKLTALRPPPKAPGGIIGKAPAKSKPPTLSAKDRIKNLFPIQGGTASEPPIPY